MCLVAQLGKQLLEKQILKIMNFDKMISILINIIQHGQYFFSFQAQVLLSYCSYQSHATLGLSLMFHHWVKNKCNRVKGRCWIWLIYAICIFLLCNNMLHIFRSNHRSWKFHKFHRKTPVLESLFSLKWQNYIKTFVLHEYAILLLKLFSYRLTS